ncbi:hypothetical protein [Streptomyces sp. NPDC049916]
MTFSMEFVLGGLTMLLALLVGSAACIEALLNTPAEAQAGSGDNLSV